MCTDLPAIRPDGFIVHLIHRIEHLAHAVCNIAAYSVFQTIAAVVLAGDHAEPAPQKLFGRFLNGFLKTVCAGRCLHPREVHDLLVGFLDCVQLSIRTRCPQILIIRSSSLFRDRTICVSQLPELFVFLEQDSFIQHFLKQHIDCSI